MNILIVKRQQDLIKAFIKERRVTGEVVELGCGDGSNLEAFSRADCTGTGFDTSEDALGIARNKSLKGFTILKGDLFNLDITGKDVILLLLTLEHLRDDASALKKINSYLRTDGWFIVSVPAGSRKYSYQDRLAGHHRRYDREHIGQLLAENGFRVKKMVSFGFPLNTMITGCYNLYLSIIGSPSVVQTCNTQVTGIAGYRKHFPGGLRQLSYLVFPVLNLLRKLDTPFLNSGLGTHYLVFAQKYRET